MANMGFRGLANRVSDIIELLDRGNIKQVREDLDLLRNDLNDFCTKRSNQELTRRRNDPYLREVHNLGNKIIYGRRVGKTDEEIKILQTQIKKATNKRNRLKVIKNDIEEMQEKLGIEKGD